MRSESLRLNWVFSRQLYDNKTFSDRPLPQAATRHPIPLPKRSCVAGSQPVQCSWHDFDPAGKDMTDPFVSDSMDSNAWKFVNHHSATKWDAQPGMSPDLKQRHAVPPHELRSFAFSDELAPWWAGQPAQPAKVPYTVDNESDGERHFTARVIGPVEEVLYPKIKAKWESGRRPSTQTWRWYWTSEMRLAKGSVPGVPSADQA